MIDKIASNVADGSIVLIGVFGAAAIPHELVFLRII
jgi:acyl CoA:acetate/3-ketoacid CoA transferase alpha subunit